MNNIVLAIKEEDDTVKIVNIAPEIIEDSSSLSGKNLKNILVRKEEDGTISIANIDPEIIENKVFSNKIHADYHHLCTDCDNCYSDKCVKVNDEEKKPIQEYDFIDEGIQIYDDRGELKFFYVTGCSKFKGDPVRKKPTTKEELEHYRRLKESIKISYFNAENIEEADRVQSDLMWRGQISFPSPYVKK